MNRRLHNTYLALAASGAMLAVALVAGTPVAEPGAAPGNAALAGNGASVPNAMQAGEAGPAPLRRDTQAGPRGPARSRQSVVMPYFSFAPRG